MAAAAAALVSIVLVVYLPDVGHGFIKDDFGWIRGSRAGGPGDVLDLFAKNVGFYRPLVALSFAADYAVWGLRAAGYGLTNLAICLADAALLYALGRRLGLAAGASLLAAGVWLLNPHAVNMALLWISGRTALLVVFFALVTAHAVIARRWAIAGAAGLAAMLCKEEAVALPALFTAFVWIDGRLHRTPDPDRTAPDSSLSGVIARTWPLWVALAIYLVLRSHSGAFGPSNAPDYYALSPSPGLVLRNIAEYADRAATASALVVILLLIAIRATRVPFTEGERRALTLAALWVPATYALTVMLPVRSSLYALLPSAGVCLAAGAIASRARWADARRFRRVAVALILIATLLIPVYRSRNRRWVALADLSAHVIETIAPDRARRSSDDTPERPTGRIILVDDPAARFNLEATFGALFPDAVALALGKGWTGAIVPPDATPPPGDAMVWRLNDERLEPSVP